MKKIVSAIMSCVLISGITFNVQTIDFNSSLGEVKAVSYGSDTLAEYAEQVAVLVNKERSSYGLQPLMVSPVLVKAANVRAVEIAERFSHIRPDGTRCFTAVKELGVQYSYAAENIAFGQKNPEKVMTAWMNSSGHRANILSDETEYIGVGISYQDGVYYWTQFFATPLPSDTSGILSDGAYMPEDTITTSTTTTTTTTTTSATTKSTASIEDGVLYGDANNNGKVEIADAVLIMQAIANKDEFGLGGSNPTAITPAGYKNADCYDPGSDLTSMDALSVQKKLVNLVELPEYSK